MSGRADDLYLAEQLKEELANDERVGELGLDVTVDGDTIYVSGSVTTAARRDAAVDVIRAIRPAAQVRTDLTVSASDPGEAETIA